MKAHGIDWAIERQGLKRIVALLFALADLADCAAERSLAVRALVLWILRPAADIALAVVIRETQRPGAQIQLPPASLSSPAGNDRADAQNLAACFRILALTLVQCLEWVGDFASLQGANRRLACAAPDILKNLRGLAFTAPACPNAYWDTS